MKSGIKNGKADGVATMFKRLEVYRKLVADRLTESCSKNKRWNALVDAVINVIEKYRINIYMTVRFHRLYFIEVLSSQKYKQKYK